MSDFAQICITAHKEAEKDAREWRQKKARECAADTFRIAEASIGVSEDGQTVTIEDIIFMADHGERGAVDFRLPWTCPKCDSWHTYHVASRSDVGRVLSMTGCSDCGG